MSLEIKTCQNCKKEFVIEQEDFAFYEKVQVPPPTWCGDCRFMRRMSFRNGWHLFKKTDFRTGEKIFSLFPEESPVKIYEKEFWNSDAWDPMEYGKEYDPSKPFLTQLYELMLKVPQPAHSITNLVNCQYCTNANNLKNCYLVRACSYSEDCAYLIWDDGSKQCLDSHMTDHCELSYGNTNVARSYKTFFSIDCDECSEVWLSEDCVSCTRCFGCIGLRNKSNHIFNIEYGKDEYNEKLAALRLGSYESFKKAKAEVYAFWQTFPKKYIHGKQNAGVSGDYIFESKNAKNCFRVRQCEDIRFCQNILRGPVKDCYDYSNWGDNVELLYECLVCGTGNSKLKFCMQCYPNNTELEYCVFCQKSSRLFGCVGLKNKEYCILNKQYTRDEYEALINKIKEDMTRLPFVSKTGNSYVYGEFLPPEFSPFPYQITEAAEFFAIKDYEMNRKDFVEYDIKKGSNVFTLSSDRIPDDIAFVSDAILKETIGCEHGGQCTEECSHAFRLIKEEIDFCKQQGIPLPRLCPSCRYYERISFRNPIRLNKRKCMCTEAHQSHADTVCLNEFETAYSLESSDIIYCSDCYNAKVI